MFRRGKTSPGGGGGEEGQVVGQEETCRKTKEGERRAERPNFGTISVDEIRALYGKSTILSQDPTWFKLTEGLIFEHKYWDTFASLLS